MIHRHHVHLPAITPLAPNQSIEGLSSAVRGEGGGGGSNLYVDGLRDVVGEKRGVGEVGSVFLVLAPVPPGGHHVGVSAQGHEKKERLVSGSPTRCERGM